MSSAVAPVRWGILGPGAIAKDFRRGVAGSRTGKLVAIGARDPSKAGLAEKFPGARILDGYDALLDDPEVDAVYIATPHPGHAEWAIKAAEAGKHVLVRKADGADRLRGRRDVPRARARPAPSSAKPSCTGCIRRPRSSVELIAVRRDRRGADDPVELRLRRCRASCPSTGCSPTISPAAASSMSAATRSRWRG